MVGRSVLGMELTEAEQTILELESKRWKYQAVKDRVVFEMFGMTPVRYSQVLLALVERPEAEAAYPMVVRRLRRLRDARRRRPAVEAV